MDSTNLPAGGVLLCRCNGRVTSRLSLDEMAAWLQAMKPGITVAIGDNLCQAKAVSRIIQETGVLPSVMAGCSHLKSEIGIWQDPEKSLFDPDSVGTVDLVHEVTSPIIDAELTDRARLLLWAQVRRQEKFTGVPSGTRRAHFGRTRGEISRRDLFHSFVPSYRVTPYIDPSLCIGDKCRICRSGCESRAISCSGNSVSIDSASCRGCGVCTILCPRQAIVHPSFSLAQLEAEIQGLLENQGALRPRIVAFTCQNAEYVHYPANVLPVAVPCLGMVSPGLMLRALDSGARGIALIADKPRCEMKLDCSNWQGTVKFVQRLLEHWHVEPERISAFNVEDADGGIDAFRRRIAALPPTALEPSQSKSIPDTSLGLPGAILIMSDKLGAETTGKIAAGTVPFGKITLDQAKCTGCGVCAVQCPTDALAEIKDQEAPRLVFRQESCVGCGQCVEMCPEKCLQLTKVLEVNRLQHEEQVIFEGSLAHCRLCGVPFAPRAMIDSVKARLGATGDAALRMETCPRCRQKGTSRLAKSGRGA